MVGLLVAAVILALPTAWNREASGRIMGLRTFPLVCVGACAYVLVGKVFIGEDHPDAMARIVQGLITGIGFVGGGAILKNGDRVEGTATASSIWLTGALGAAVAFEAWHLAIVLSLLNFLVVWLFSRAKEHVPTNGDG